MARTQLPAPALDEASPPVAKAMKAVLTKQGTVERMKKTATALGKALARDPRATAKLHALVADLAAALAGLGPLHLVRSKPLRLTAFERQSQLEMMAYGLRIAAPVNDRLLAATAAKIADGPIRGTLADVLTGGQIGLSPGALEEVAALFDSTSDKVVMRCALHAQYAIRPSTAHAHWTAILRGGSRAKSERDALCVGQVLDAIEALEADHTPWAPLVYPLATHAVRTIAIGAGGFLAKQRASFLGYLGWALEQGHSRAVIDVVSHQLYWAKLGGKLTAADLEKPLGDLLARATAKKDRASVDALGRALKKVGIELGVAAPAKTLGAPLARVGTEGGPPLVVPAEHLAAWLGVAGPRPFDTGGSDYERACDAKRPSVIRVGAGHGVVLDGQACDVHAIDGGLLFISDGSPDEEVAKGWKKVGTLAVGQRGLVVLDAAEVGKDRGANRKSVALAAGTYRVWGHRPEGFGGDFSAMRLLREGTVTASGSRARRTGRRRSG
jgi:hypothetical protein